MHVIDSHTGGEPTRVILDGGPDLGGGSLAERARRLASEKQDFCRAVLAEPRGQTAMVAAMLTPPTDPGCVTGVLYFDAAAVLGMCGHGTIGLAATLVYLGRIGLGKHKIETPAGLVEVDVNDDASITLANVESRRTQKSVEVMAKGVGTVRGDVAYGGNWFYIVDPSPIAVTPDNVHRLTAAGLAVREALATQGVTGDQGAILDHVMFYGPALNEGGHSRNFVLCPDDTYDRSPCGTGSSARLACLAADGRLSEHENIFQESIIGSRYRLSYRKGPKGGVLPSITGQAYVMAETKLIFDPKDPFRQGIFW